MARAARRRASTAPGAAGGDSRRVVAAYVDTHGDELVCAFADGEVVRVAPSKLGVPSRPRVVLAVPDDFGAGIVLLRIDGSQDECAADLVRYTTDAPYRVAHAVGEGKSLARRVGARARRLRQALGMTQCELAGRLGVAAPNYARLEAGRHVPSVTTLVRLAQVLGVPLEHLVARQRGS